jgi:hypothetical protein
LARRESWEQPKRPLALSENVRGSSSWIKLCANFQMFLGDTPEVVLREGIVGWKFMYNSEYCPWICDDKRGYNLVQSCH